MEEMNLNQEQAVTKMLIAITKKKEKRLVPTLDGLTGDYTVDGVAVIAPEVSFAISLSDDSFPFMPGGSPDMAENVATTSNNETNGMASTEHLIELLGLEDGSACVEATKHGGWLQSVGEANVIKAHLAEINEKMEAAGGTYISGQYWTSSLFSQEYAWHLDTEKGIRMYRGMGSSLRVRAIFSIEDYSE